ncbi:hypothetical protein FK220_013105, partial [Flavobacteriaceae bacterium TP-CH-4]|nr:hypothetical protein [Pelagihabitans pacificus]
MKNKYLLFTLICSIFTIPYSYCQIQDELKAFPSAEGFGKYATGGRTGQVIKVNNLDSSGEESLRRALTTSGPRYIVFEKAGYITPGSSSIVPLSDYTLFGQSAFRAGGDGISLRQQVGGNTTVPLLSSGGTEANGWGNAVMRYIRFRGGTNNGQNDAGDNFEPWGNDGVHIIDHCSFAFGVDENVSFSTQGSITMQYSIISSALAYAGHESNGPLHSMGTLTSATPNVTYFGNLMANNNQRNPNIQGKSTGDTKIEFVNNYIYNHGAFGIQINPGIGTYKADFIGNKMKPGPNTNTNRYGFHWPDNRVFTSPNFANHRLYVNDNYSHKRTLSSQTEWAFVGSDDDNINAISEGTHRVMAPFNFTGLATKAIPSGDLESIMLPHIGASMSRDAEDVRSINNAISNTGEFINGDGFTGGGYRQFSEAAGYDSLNDVGTIIDTNNNGISDNLEAPGVDFGNGIRIPAGQSLTGSHNQVIPYYENEAGQLWANPGYELIEVVYFNQQDYDAMTWVTASTNSCPDTLTNEDGAISFLAPVWEDNLQGPDYVFAGVGAGQAN